MRKSRIIVWVTAFALILSVWTPFYGDVYAAKTSVKISPKKATLTVGSTLQLKLKGTSKKPKWSSNKKSVATVSKKGKVKAKKVGKATITAKVGAKKYTCKITVKKATPPKPAATDLDLLAKGNFTMFYKQELYYPEFTYSLEIMQGYSGKNSVFLSAGDVPLNGYLKSRILQKDGWLYMIDEVKKTYIKNPASQDDDGEFTGIFPSDPSKIKMAGQEKFNGIQCSYAEFQTETGPMRWYFNSQKKLVGVKAKARVAGVVDSKGQYINEMLIDTIWYVRTLRPSVSQDFALPADFSTYEKLN